MDAAPSPVAITDDSFLSPTGALLSADTERVSDGLLFQLLGKVGRRRHKRQKVTRRWQQTAPSADKKEETMAPSSLPF